MSEFRQKRSFEKAFINAIPNFDETRIWFEYTKRYNKHLVVCFVYNNQLMRFPMYMCQFEIDTWKNHFIDFLKTNVFDMHFYSSIYTNNGNVGEILKFEFTTHGKNNFYDHSDKLFEYLQNYRENIDKTVGIHTVQKPLNYEL